MQENSTPKAKPSLHSDNANGRTCKRCLEFKPFSELYVIKKTGIFRPYCRPCQKAIAHAHYIKHRDGILASNRRWLEKNRERNQRNVRNWHYKKHYGLTEEAKRMMEIEQGNRCAICATHFSELDQRRIHVDHCHATGQIRGVLCHCCNQVLGQARDNPGVLKAAIRYLAKHRSRHDSGKDAFA